MIAKTVNPPKFNITFKTETWESPFDRVRFSDPLPKYQKLKWRKEDGKIIIKYNGNILETVPSIIRKILPMDKKEKTRFLRELTDGQRVKFTAYNGFVYGVKTGKIKLPEMCPDTDSERFNVEGVV